MHFLISWLNKSVKLFFYNLLFFMEDLKWQYYYKPFNSLIQEKNYRWFTKYLSDRFYEYEYIYHWNKLWPTYKKSFKPSLTSKINKNNSKTFVTFTVEYVSLYFTNFFSFTKHKKYFTGLYSQVITRVFGFGFYYMRGIVFLLFIDACLTDDEPLWEPIEWSLVQTWILFIFSFAWIAENLIVSRYGSYTGRDKRVWMSWYKTFWLIEGYYVLNYGLVCVFFILPFYFELNYNLSFVYSWWHWYSRVFFFKFLASYSLILFVAYLLQLNVTWLNWKKGLIAILLINVFIAYLIYTHFIIVFFGYFTDPLWYQKTRPVDYVQLSHEPSRWGWGPAKKDHFTYHNVKTVFWFKNDGPFAASFLMFHLFLFICIFFLFIFWLSLLRRVWSTKELPITLTTYCVSSLRQFFYFFFFLYFLVFMSYMTNYVRMPADFYFFLNQDSWFYNFFIICINYKNFLFSILS